MKEPRWAVKAARRAAMAAKRAVKEAKRAGKWPEEPPKKPEEPPEEERPEWPEWLDKTPMRWATRNEVSTPRPSAWARSSGSAWIPQLRASQPRMKGKPESKSLRVYLLDLLKLLGEECSQEKEALTQLRAALEGLHDIRDTLEKRDALLAYLQSPHTILPAAMEVAVKLDQMAPMVERKERERVRAEARALRLAEWRKHCAINEARAQGFLPPDPEEQERAREREERAGMRIGLSYGE